ncbi:hypothetical protein [Leptospira alstonii]|uniref:hypothetical protein n=1 Tax=Leptospira alstonii TaxID=28452 RepID=UPI0005683530|nr:hypothetical protein [Leptospira alstonii]
MGANNYAVGPALQTTKFDTLRCRSSSGLRGKDRARQGKNDVHFACRARPVYSKMQFAFDWANFA